MNKEILNSKKIEVREKLISTLKRVLKEDIEMLTNLKNSENEMIWIDFFKTEIENRKEEFNDFILEYQNELSELISKQKND